MATKKVYFQNIVAKKEIIRYWRSNDLPAFCLVLQNFIDFIPRPPQKSGCWVIPEIESKSEAARVARILEEVVQYLAPTVHVFYSWTPAKLSVLNDIFQEIYGAQYL